MDVILNLIFSYRNFVLAGKKGESPWKWAIITFLVWMIFESMGGFLYASIIGIDLSNIENWSSNPGKVFVLSLFGIGCGYLGYLLVRRSLHSKADIDNETRESNEE